MESLGELSHAGGRGRAVGAGLLLALVAFSIWIGWRAKHLEISLDTIGVSSEMMDKPAQAFSLPTLDGRSMALDDYRGRQEVVVAFWASWCEPCQAEAPILSQFYRDHHKTDAPFELLAISIDDDASAAAAFQAKNRLPYPVLLDTSGKIADLYHAGGIPALYVVDKTGKVIYAQAGLQPGLGVLLPVILKLPGATSFGVTTVPGN